MRVLDSPQSDSSELPDAEVLIEEARHRQGKRRLRVGVFLLVVAGASGAWAASGHGSGVTPPSSSNKPVKTKTPGSAPISASKGATSVSIDFDGKYGVSAPAFPTAAEGFVSFGGFSGGNEPSASWLERTTNGGRTWSVGPSFEQGYLAFNSAADGWLHGGSLYKTTDAGLTWHRVPIAGLLGLGSVVTDGRYTWVDEQPKPTASTNPECEPTLLLRSTSFGANPGPISVQPSLGGYCSTQFVAPTGLSAYVLFVNRSGASRIAATDSGGNSWAFRAAPCDGFLVAESSSLLGLSCPYGQVLDISGDRRVRTFQSTDGGSTWSKIRPFNGGFVNENGPLVGSYVESSSLVAWSWTEYVGSGAGAVERTADGGRHWRIIFPNGLIHVSPPLTPVLEMMPLDFVARSSSSVYLIVEVYAVSGPTHFLLGTTTNGGNTWRWSYLVNEGSDATKGRAG